MMHARRPRPHPHPRRRRSCRPRPRPRPRARSRARSPRLPPRVRAARPAAARPPPCAGAAGRLGRRVAAARAAWLRCRLARRGHSPAAAARPYARHRE
eukprot:scaffold99588_cov48-Phaeocystis_antarctica.AAC.1